MGTASDFIRTHLYRPARPGIRGAALRAARSRRHLTSERSSNAIPNGPSAGLPVRHERRDPGQPSAAAHGSTGRESL